MGKGTVTPGRPLVWRIDRIDDDPNREILCFGNKRVILADVTAISSEVISDDGNDGLVLGTALFLIFACAIMFAVFDGPLSSRFLLGTVFLTFLAYMGFQELPRIKTQQFHRVYFTLAGGETVVFASSYRHEFDALMTALALR